MQQKTANTSRLNRGGEGARKLSESCFASTRQKALISYCVKSKIEISSVQKRKLRLELVWVTQSRIPHTYEETWDGNAEGKMERKKEEDVGKKLYNETQ